MLFSGNNPSVIAEHWLATSSLLSVVAHPARSHEVLELIDFCRIDVLEILLPVAASKACIQDGELTPARNQHVFEAADKSGFVNNRMVNSREESQDFAELLLQLLADDIARPGVHSFCVGQ